MIRNRFFAALAGVLMLVTIGCYNPNEAIDTMQNAGFTDITIQDYSYFAGWQGCGEDDLIAYQVTATNINKKSVNVVVCCGTIKRCTIRY